MKKIGIIVVIIIIVIAIAIVVFNNILNTTTDETENIVENAETSSNEEDILVTEIDTPETDETWEWQHDTPENHNIDITQCQNSKSQAHNLSPLYLFFRFSK